MKNYNSFKQTDMFKIKHRIHDVSFRVMRDRRCINVAIILPCRSETHEPLSAKNDYNFFYPTTQQSIEIEPIEALPTPLYAFNNIIIYFTLACQA